jgi:murein DD-endopeptidase MepM/ murein hydrolase activator NlpD
MKSWPVKDSYSKEIPKQGSAGSFWEDRKDRHHCGIDIYAPKGSEVVSIEEGVVIGTGISLLLNKYLIGIRPLCFN